MLVGALRVCDFGARGAHTSEPAADGSGPGRGRHRDGRGDGRAHMIPCARATATGYCNRVREWKSVCACASAHCVCEKERDDGKGEKQTNRYTKYTRTVPYVIAAPSASVVLYTVLSFIRIDTKFSMTDDMQVGLQGLSSSFGTDGGPVYDEKLRINLK